MCLGEHWEDEMYLPLHFLTLTRLQAGLGFTAASWAPAKQRAKTQLEVEHFPRQRAALQARRGLPALWAQQHQLLTITQTG